MKKAGKGAIDKHVVQKDQNVHRSVTSKWLIRSADSNFASRASLHMDLPYKDRAAATQVLHDVGQHKAPRKRK